MRFALLGDHDDGKAFAEALRATGRHEIVAERRADQDLEEVLADPKVEACIVAVAVHQRLDVTRRVLQSERHAVVVHPVDVKPDGAYELNMLQGDVHQVLMPLLLYGLIDTTERVRQSFADSQLIELDVTHPTQPLLAIDEARRHPVFPMWELLRAVGGEIVEVTAFARDEEAEDDQPIVVAGRFESGKLFQSRFRLAIGESKLYVRVIGPNASNEFHIESENWLPAVTEFERELAFLASIVKADPAAGARERPGARLSWRDEIRCAELDDSAARSLSKRRTMLLDYQEANEEVGFKGTMTLVGCGMLWLLLVVLIAAMLYPPLFWISVPILFGFLALQLFRWVIPRV